MIEICQRTDPSQPSPPSIHKRISFGSPYIYNNFESFAPPSPSNLLARTNSYQGTTNWPRHHAVGSIAVAVADLGCEIKKKMILFFLESSFSEHISIHRERIKQTFYIFMNERVHEEVFCLDSIYEGL